MDKAGEFPGYAITSHLADGSICTVFTAIRAHDNKPCILKTYNTSTDSHRSLHAIRHFSAELDVLTVFHANSFLPRLLGFGHTAISRMPFLVLEHIYGVDIASFARTASRHALLASLAAACRFLDYFHRRGFIHGDLKSAHLLVPSDASALKQSSIKLIDFGSSHRQSEGTFHDALVLTPSYAAPETLNEGGTSYSSDLYALGKILSECLLHPATDRRAVPNSQSMADQHIERELQSLCTALQVPNPEDRTLSALDIAVKLERLIHDESSHTVSSVPPVDLSPSLVSFEHDFNRITASIIHAHSTGQRPIPLLLNIHAIHTPLLDAISRHLLLRSFRHGFAVQLVTTLEELSLLQESLTPPSSRPWVLSLCLPSSQLHTASLMLASLNRCSTPPAAILLLRPPSWDNALEAAFATVRQQSQPDSLQVSAHTKSMIANAVADSLGVPLAPSDLVSDLYTASGGHPFLVDALLREHYSRGTVSFDEGVLRYSRSALTHDLALSVCTQMLQSLLHGDTDILRLLCTSTAPLSAPDIAGFLERKRDSVEDALLRLHSLGLVSLAPARRDAYTVLASLLRLALTHPRDANLAAPLHHRLAKHFETDTRSSFSLAYAANHYAASGDKRSSQRCYYSSGRGLVANGEYHHALEPLRQALHLSESGSNQAAEITALLASALVKSGQHHECRDILLRLNVSEHLPPDILVSLSLSRAYCDLALSHYTEGIANARTALRLAKLHRLTGQAIRAQVIVGDGLCALEQRSEGRRTLFRSLAAARRSKQLSFALDALRIIGASHWREGAYRRALKYERRRSRLLRRAGDSSDLATSLLNTGILLADIGNYAAARSEYRVVRRLGNTLSLPRIRSSVHVNVGETLRAQGLFKPAIRLNAIAAEEFQNAGDPHHSLIATLNHAQILSRTGYPGPAFPLVRHIGSSPPITTIPSLSLAYLLTWGYLLVSCGAYTHAIRVVNRAIGAAADMRLKQSLLELHVLRAMCEVGLGLPSDALAHLRDAISAHRSSAPYDVRLYADVTSALITITAGLHHSGTERLVSGTMAKARHHKLRTVLSECCMVQSSLLLSAANAEGAASYASLAVSLAQESRNRDVAWRSFWLLARIGETQLLFPRALRHLRRATHILREISLDIDDVRFRQSFLARKDVRQVIDHYRRLQSDFGRKARYETAALRRSESISRKMLASLGEIGQRLSSTRDLDELLDRILDLAIENVRAERGIVFLRPPERGEMQVANARGLGNRDLEDLSTFSRSVVARAADGQVVHTMDVGQDPALSSVQSIIVHEIKSILCVPMKSRGEVLGVIYLDTRKKTQLFTDKERTFVESFANQAAIAIENARVFGRMREENIRLRRQSEGRFPELVGASGPMRQLQKLIGGVIDVDCTVLITGESGTGKGVIARTIHAHGSRREGPFLTVDCGALPENLLEGELFGYKRGAFTGAEHDRVGLLEEANDGTLFLDEIANTSTSLQARLLRVLQEREIRRLGENQARRVNVRVIAATNADLPSLIAQGRFRQDLYYRLNVISIAAPPLRDRREDIPLLVASFLKRHARDGEPVRTLGPGVLEALQHHAWPGNVRELENMMERIMVLSQREIITQADLPEDLRPGHAQVASGDSTEDSSAESFGVPPRRTTVRAHGETQPRGVSRKTGEQIMIEDALRRFQGDKTKAARFIGWNRQKLYRRIKSFSIPADFGKAA